ncbi:MAG: flagellar filament capping protein FliD [Treponema sp.]|jgi:flagellar hook-associated protein 2|nr:flagellar filament capping protein FliD [Treponema sp.]
MSDVYMPGISSRFNTDRIVEGLMKIERIPRDRSEREKERLQAQKTYWQDVNRRMVSLRDSARQLYSFQNPFNDRIITSSDASVLTGGAVRQTMPQTKEFTVKQIAQADRFLSSPVDDSFTVEAGVYTFDSGPEHISFNFKGGSLKDFVDALNRRGKGKIEASFVTVQSGKKSLLIESKITGEENNLVFSDAALDLALKSGVLEQQINLQDVAITLVDGGGAVQDAGQTGQEVAAQLSAVDNDSLKVSAAGGASIAFPDNTVVSQGLTIFFETAVKVLPTEPPPKVEPPPGPSVPQTGSVTFNGIVIDSAPSSVPIPEWKPPEPPPRIDDMNVLSLTFSDGTNIELAPIEDASGFTRVSFQIPDSEIGKTLVSLNIANKNTHRDVSLRRIQIMDPSDPINYKPANPVSVAQDAVVSMDGISVSRATNTIDDLLPGITIAVKKPSDTPVRIAVEADRDAIKDAIITFVGNYNRVMAEINVLTRNDDRIVQELSYLSEEEQGDMRNRMGAFAGDSTLTQYKNAAQNAVTAPYSTATGTEMLAKYGIGADMRMSGGSSGYDPSRLRGYLEIDEKKLDEALEINLAEVQQLFGFDSNGDLIVDSGVAYSLESLTRPYVETGGLIFIRTATIDSRIKADEQRIATLDKQLAEKEAALRIQYSQMENAYNRMEQMSNSLENFSRQNSNNGR